MRLGITAACPGEGYRDLKRECKRGMGWKERGQRVGKLEGLKEEKFDFLEN